MAAHPSHLTSAVPSLVVVVSFSIGIVTTLEVAAAIVEMNPGRSRGSSHLSA